tara:strand:+ start:237 stop:695 length:459 start_codon:yes stop_codon:yes gene_type:complete
MKRNLFISLLISSWIFNSGFLFRPNIKVLTCGDNDYLSNISSEDEKEIIKEYPWIFDTKSGQPYEFDQNRNTLKPVKSEIINDIEYIYEDFFVRDGILYIDSLDRILETNETIFTTIRLDFKKLKVTFINKLGQSESNCKEIKLPKDIRILK